MNTSEDARFVTGSHDLPVSAALAEFFQRGWAPSDLPVASVPAAVYAAKRRAAVSARFPGERLVIPAGGLKVRSNDCDYPFRPHTAYAHLTAETAAEAVPDAVLVLEPTPSGHEAVVYTHPRSPRDGSPMGAQFYRDRRHGELWVGRRRTLTETEAALGLAAADLATLPARIASGAAPVRVVRGVDEAVDGLVPAPADGAADDELHAVLAELRLVKDEYEAGQLQAAVDFTIAGFGDVAAALPAAIAHPRGERWIEATFNRRARLEGNGTGYETIAAAGAHACVLHWIRNDGPVPGDQLLLLDAGVEADSFYTADVTRTIPAGGTFTDAQRRVYDLVYAAQEAAIAAVRPGARFRDFHNAATRVIAEGLDDWGLLPGGAEAALDPDSGLYRRYTLCSSGHMLGMDVHDCAKARAETYLDGVIEPGHVLTVEPGLYLQPDDLTLPAELRGIGVRIEDDLLVTETGAVNLSAALPRQADDIEAWLADHRG
ncbi:aminopeptidase P N-terminal domain-containing protein [Actinocorallia sp. API 0066]|uniref:aminopeptidase P N-terminal domain-containing protein n=1 Tax=Actinocorallia sp. API 0066 TaxID=2896846 RepID=UPI001E2D414C|nr:aminopeptidase P N-terminal domain-containing protein [Actinocorallia sp. API 0066]MCD0450795.1 aminopeptidase P N-terminal domain-containing protein [Actinocorallia sp. API 0066]